MRAIQMYKKPTDNNFIQGILTPSHTLGCIIKLSGNTYKKMNGFPNNLWGWGREDDIFQKRAKYYNIKFDRFIIRGRNNYKIYFKEFGDHDRDKSNLGNNIKADHHFGKSKTKEEDIKNNGLTTLNYKLKKESTINNYIKHIVVDI